MGWTIYYEINSVDPITDEEISLLEAASKHCNSLLHIGSEDFYFERESLHKMSGFTKVHYSTRDAKDYLIILETLQEIRKNIPNINIFVSDDYYLERCRPENLGNIKEYFKKNQIAIYDNGYSIINLISAIMNIKLSIYEFFRGKRFF